VVSVLFVDDDASCLRALKDTYSACAEETLFVRGAGAALDAMAERPVDAVVASARLSGIGAAALLRTTKREHPRTARIALSAPGDRTAMLRTVPVANQCLSRACGPEVLARVLERTTNLHGKLFSDATARLAAEVGTLPSLPASLVALDAALSNDECSLAQVAEIVSQDVAMAAKVLQLVNSPYFGLRSEIRDLRQAVAYLGIETLRDFALAGAVFRAFTPSPLLPDGWLESFNAHALSVADGAAHLVRTSLAQCEASMAGMLHGIGELVVAERAPNKLLAIAVEVTGGAAADDAEVRHIGTTFPIIGGYLLSEFGMGYPIVEAVTCQREVWEGPSREPQLADVVRLGDYLAAQDRAVARYEEEFVNDEATSMAPDDWVCPSSQVMEIDEDAEERVGLLGAARIYRQGLVGKR